jgi:hypothetical protein
MTRTLTASLFNITLERHDVDLVIKIKIGRKLYVRPHTTEVVQFNNSSTDYINRCNSVVCVSR